MDWYSLGVLIFETFNGDPPFFASTQNEIFENIKTQELMYPSHMPVQVKDLVSKLMERDPAKRLLNLKKPGIKSHPWFDGIGNSYLLLEGNSPHKIFSLGKIEF